MATDPLIPADVYRAARDMFHTTTTETARALEQRANGESYTLTFGPIVDRVVDVVWTLAREKGAK
jgi:hypothetical protein